jgi:DEAD/DEAH box helicase domain-containing protein
METTTDNIQEIPDLKQNVLVFDIETQRGFNEIRSISDMGVAVAVSCNCSNTEYKYYTEDNVQELIDDIFNADVVVGYNCIHFDYTVLKGYTDKDFSSIKTIDMMQIVQRSLGFRPKLDNLLEATFGEKKTADGLQSLRWYKQGKIDLIKEYCYHDVRLTTALYEFGRDNGYVWVRNKSGLRVQVQITWH